MLPLLRVINVTHVYAACNTLNVLNGYTCHVINVDDSLEESVLVTDVCDATYFS